MNVIDHLTTNIPHPKDITSNLPTSMEIMKNIKKWEIVVGRYPKLHHDFMSMEVFIISMIYIDWQSSF
jgi:hypothetical protein